MAVSLVREMAPAAAVVMPVTVENEPLSCGFVRRDQELGTLLALLDPRHSEASAGIVVSGMAGVGKTALARQAGPDRGRARLVSRWGGDRRPAWR